MIIFLLALALPMPSLSDDLTGGEIDNAAVEPTETPTVSPAQTVSDYIVYWAYQEGRPDIISVMHRVAMCESGMQLYPHDGGAGEVGPFQFHPRGLWQGMKRVYWMRWGWLSFDDLRDPETNVRLAVHAFAAGYANHWSCY